MKKKEVDVKSKGDTIGKVTITVYDSTTEAEKALGPEKCLGFINRQNRADVMNEFRGNATRSVSSTAQLKKMGEKNPARAAAIEALLQKFEKEDETGTKSK